MGDAKSVRISAIICTYRNPGFLEGAIRSLLNQTLPADQYEIIVVDNNSRDETPDIVRQLAAEAAPAIHYILETRQGLSHARNTGIEAAQGEIVAFIDDDAEAEADWLSALLDAYDGNPDVWAAGGKILPIWHTAERPAWFTDEFLGWLSLLDWGDESRALVWPERILGTNCSFRKSIFPTVGYFDPKLGRKGKALLGHEDTELQQRIPLNNKIVYYAANAIVYHHVPPQRLTEDYFFQRQSGAARSQMALLIKQEGYARAFRQVLMYGLLLGQRLLIIARIVLTRKSQVPFTHKRMLSFYWGQVVGFVENLSDFGTK
jgi:glycosyltransferase involved in cell wall biosynthesis